MIKNILKQQRNLLLIVLILSTVLAVIINWQAKISNATQAPEVNLNPNNKLEKTVIDYTDVVNGTSVDGDNSYKRVVVYSMAASNLLTGIVNVVDTQFQEPIYGQNDSIDIVNIHVEDANGNWISTGDLAHVPVTLNQHGSYPYLENRQGDAQETGFYSESNALDVVYYIRCYRCNLNNLTQGKIISYHLVSTK